MVDRGDDHRGDGAAVFPCRPGKCRGDADTNQDGSGAEAYDLSIPRITAYQEEFVRKVVDTVNDLDNVLYEIGNEGDFTSVRFQYHFIRFIKAYEAKQPKQHPVGMTAVFNILQGNWTTDNRALFESPADWISPGLDPYKDNPPASDGGKVIIADVGHIWPNSPPRGSGSASCGAFIPSTWTPTLIRYLCTASQRTSKRRCAGKWDTH
jgi:hypothetical protein